LASNFSFCGHLPLGEHRPVKKFGNLWHDEHAKVHDKAGQ
jgi:hypothetical protein